MKSFSLPLMLLAAIGAGAVSAFTIPGTKMETVVNCYQNVTAVCPPIVLTGGQTSCATAVAQVGKGANSASGFANGIDCDGNVLFCCAHLVKVQGPICAGHFPITFIDQNGVTQVNAYAKIQAVYCKS